MKKNAYNGVFKVGYSKIDITPEKLPILATESRAKYFTVVKDPLFATCVAVHDGEETVLIITLDLKGTYDYIIDNMNRVIMEATGLTRESIMISAIHNHSAPASSDDGDRPKFDWDEGIYEWLDNIIAKMGDLALAAIDDLTPAEIYTAKKDTAGMAYVRRYVHADGGYSSIQNVVGEASTAPLVGHETDADAELQIIKFARAGKKDVILSNWQGHVAHAVGHFSEHITADLVYYARREVERSGDYLYAYYAGASGNLNLVCKVLREGCRRYASYVEVGEAIGEIIRDTVRGEMVKVSAGKIKKSLINVRVRTRKDAPERIKQAHEVQDSAYDPERRKALGFASSYEINAYIDREMLGETQDIPLGAISFGDIAFVSAPYEMFDTNGMEVKAGSPFGTTFVLSCAGGNYDYIPSNLAFPHGGYEVFRCRYVKGTAEQLVDGFHSMLQEQWLTSRSSL